MIQWIMVLFMFLASTTAFAGEPPTLVNPPRVPEGIKVRAAPLPDYSGMIAEIDQKIEALGDRTRQLELRPKGVTRADLDALRNEILEEIKKIWETLVDHERRITELERRIAELEGLEDRVDELEVLVRQLGSSLTVGVTGGVFLGEEIPGFSGQNVADGVMPEANLFASFVSGTRHPVILRARVGVMTERSATFGGDVGVLFGIGPQIGPILGATVQHIGTFDVPGAWAYRGSVDPGLMVRMPIPSAERSGLDLTAAARVQIGETEVAWDATNHAAIVLELGVGLRHSLLQSRSVE